MASVTGITAAKANEILGQSVVSGVVNENGSLILTRNNGSTINAGNYLDVYINNAISNIMVGQAFDLGSISGVINFDEASNTELVNSIFRVTLTGDVSINSSTAMPDDPIPGTQFAVRFKQDATGTRLLTLTGFKKSMGVLELSTAANAIDIIVFMFDGVDWYAGAMGLSFS